MIKTGLYFGSFNPIHVGHMAIANYMVEYTEIDQLWFVVSPHNPLKNKKTLLDDYQRRWTRLLDDYAEDPRYVTNRLRKMARQLDDERTQA